MMWLVGWLVNIGDTVIPILCLEGEAGWQLLPLAASLGWSPATGARRSASIASYDVQALQIQVPVSFPCGPVEEHSTITLSLCFININHNFFNHQISSEYYPASGCLMFLDVFIAVVNDICAGRSFPWSRHPCLLAPTTSIRCRPASEACSLCLMCFFYCFCIWSCLPFEEYLVTLDHFVIFCWTNRYFHLEGTERRHNLESELSWGHADAWAAAKENINISKLRFVKHVNGKSQKMNKLLEGNFRFCVLNICFGQASVRQQLKDTNLLSFYMLSLSFL